MVLCSCWTAPVIHALQLANVVLRTVKSYAQNTKKLPFFHSNSTMFEASLLSNAFLTILCDVDITTELDLCPLQ